MLCAMCLGILISTDCLIQFPCLCLFCWDQPKSSIGRRFFWWVEKEIGVFVLLAPFLLDGSLLLLCLKPYLSLSSLPPLSLQAVDIIGSLLLLAPGCCFIPYPDHFSLNNHFIQPTSLGEPVFLFLFFVFF